MSVPKWTKDWPVYLLPVGMAMNNTTNQALPAQTLPPPAAPAAPPAPPAPPALAAATVFELVINCAFRMLNGPLLVLTWVCRPWMLP